MIAGVDFDTHAIHVVVLDEDTGSAVYHRFAIDVGPGDYHERARRVPLCLPVRGAWKDNGVRLVAVEKPASSHFRAAVALGVIRGALLASLPREDQVPLVMIPVHDWKKWSVGGGFPGMGNCDKPQVALWAKSKWSDRPPDAGQDAFDAYAIAWAARALDVERIRSAA